MENTINGGIYKISSKIYLDRFYIGRSKNCKIRFAQHKNLLLNKKHHSVILQNHINKHGIEDLNFEQIIFENSFHNQIKLESDLLKVKPFFNVTSNALGGRAPSKMLQKINAKNVLSYIKEFEQEIIKGSEYHIKLFMKLYFGNPKPTFNKEDVIKAFLKSNIELY
jgi:hypothetical protein